MLESGDQDLIKELELVRVKMNQDEELSPTERSLLSSILDVEAIREELQRRVSRHEPHHETLAQQPHRE